MNDSFGGDFSATQTASAVAEPAQEGFAPVLIKQLLDSPEGHFQLWGLTFGVVSCVGLVRSIDTSSTKITYLLEDTTGRIEAHYWLEEGDALKAPDIMLNNYAKVYGSVRSQGGQKTLMVFKMFPITGPNEICTHMLEVLNARYKSEEFAKKDYSASKYGKDNTTIQSTNKGGNNMGLGGNQLAVFQAIKGHLSEEGISRDELRRKCPQISKSELETILDFMSSEGHIYSSIDADHFLSTENL